MVRRAMVLILSLFGLALAVPAQAVETDGCVPPCLWIYPTIDLEVDLAPEHRAASNLDELPAVVDVHVRYQWDLQEDGTGVPGPQPSEIHLSLTKVPYWLDATLSSKSCPFQPLPHEPDQEICTIQMHLTTLGIPQNAAALESGDRLILMAMSEESGSYKQGYGVESVRFQWDGADEEAAPASLPPAPVSKTAIPLVLTLFSVVLVAFLVSRRFRTQP